MDDFDFEATGISIEEQNGLYELDGNSECVDCGQSNPDWASLTYGSLLCLHCAGIHRGMGVDLSFVRSLSLDRWSDKEKELMFASNNEFVNKYFIDKGVVERGQDRYLTEAGALLRQVLKKKFEGQDDFLSVSLSQEDRDLLYSQQRIYREQCSFRSQDASLIEKARPWIPDKISSECMICRKKFTLLFRRHHCRNCGRLVCENCAPKNNTKPIPKLNFRTPVRHCKECFKSANVEWKEV